MVTYVKYIFDPDTGKITTQTCHEPRGSKYIPAFGKVLHYNGKRYFVATPCSTPGCDGYNAATEIFKQYYLDKLATTAFELSKITDILAKLDNRK